MSKEEGNLITDKMVKKATFLIHKLAKRRAADFKDIQKKCKKYLGYENLAKVSLENGHQIIEKLLALTGGEEEIPKEETKPKDDLSQNSGATVTDDGSTAKEIVVPKKEEEKSREDEDLVTSTMRKAVRAAVNITLDEVVEREVPVQGLGGFVLELGKVIFEAKMSEEAD